MVESKHIGYMEYGTVLDHLPCGKIFQIAKALKLDIGEERVSLGDNYPSKKYGSKGFIKIEGRELSERDKTLLAILAPNVSISLIKKGIVESKEKPTIPELLEGIVGCKNPECITKQKHSHFGESRMSYSNGKFSCHYCGYSFPREEFEVKV